MRGGDQFAEGTKGDWKQLCEGINRHIHRLASCVHSAVAHEFRTRKCMHAHEQSPPLTDPHIRVLTTRRWAVVAAACMGVATVGYASAKGSVSLLKMDEVRSAESCVVSGHMVVAGG